MEKIKRPKVGVVAIVQHGKKFLLGLRKTGHSPGSWGFPGGELIFGESPEVFLIRKTKEETGLTIKNLHFLTFTNYFYQDVSEQYVCLFFLAESDSDQAIDTEGKHEEWRWCEWNKFPEPLTKPIDQILNQFPKKPF